MTLLKFGTVINNSKMYFENYKVPTIFYNCIIQLLLVAHYNYITIYLYLPIIILVLCYFLTIKHLLIILQRNIKYVLKRIL